MSAKGWMAETDRMRKRQYETEMARAKAEQERLEKLLGNMEDIPRDKSEEAAAEVAALKEEKEEAAKAASKSKKGGE